MMCVSCAFTRPCSAGVNQAWACSVAATMQRWVSTAPLDRPVVPPVYWRKATESSPAWLGRSSFWAPRASAWEKVVTSRTVPPAPSSGRL